MIKINMFQASYGDSLLVQVEKVGDATVNLMIDCGLNYKNNILPNLKRLPKDQTINRFIITHYDKDHIQSASKFLEDNGEYKHGNIAQIEQVWLNTFKHLQFSKRNTEELSTEEKDKVKNYISETSSKSDSEINEGDIGAKQATTLGTKILEKKYPWNIDSNGKAICIENLQEINVTEDVKLFLLSPNKKRLQNLEGEFLSKLSEMGLNPNTEAFFDDAFELFNLNMKEKEKEKVNNGNISSSCIPEINSRSIKILSKGEGYEKDTSFGNGSSITFILETEGKKILFLADAFAQDIIEELKKRYPDSSEYPIFFEAIKTSHHGSFKNNSPELFKIIDSNIFLFSTNGNHPCGHKHPDVETISCIINRSLPKKILKRKLIFNYELDHLKDFNNEELKKEFKYEIKTQIETKI
jgi:beta-lactamase superfamily II metal-dependent hydrolase